MKLLLAPLVVTLLGTGNPRPIPERYGPAILVEASTNPPTRILVDAGRGAAERLFTIGGREGLSSIDLVLLTHLHSDHVVGLADVWLTGWLFGRSRALSVVALGGGIGMTCLPSLRRAQAAATCPKLHCRRPPP